MRPARSAAILIPLRCRGRMARSPSIPASLFITKPPTPISPLCSSISTCRRNRPRCRFAVSLADGDLEYSGGNLSGLFAEKRNLFRPRFWSMLRDLQRFYREAPRDLALLEEFHTTLGDYLDASAYGAAFRNDHLLPMAAAIWSAPDRFDPRLSGRVLHPLPGQSWPAPAAQSSAMANRARRQPRLCRTLDAALCGPDPAFGGGRDRAAERRKRRHSRLPRRRRNLRSRRDRHARRSGVGDARRPDGRRSGRLLGAFRYSRNLAVLHSDPGLMPKRRAVWSSWNHIGPDNSDDDDGACPTVTYWMNALQNIPHDTPLFVTLNPKREPARRMAQRDVRASAVRFGGDRRAAAALVAAGPPQHLVLRRLFRRWLP